MEDIFLDENQLSTLPATVGNLSKLSTIQLRDNLVTTLPPEIGDCRDLWQLSLERNLITSLPSEIASLHKLRGLFVRDNKLSSFPNLTSNSNRSNLSISIENNLVNVNDIAANLTGTDVHEYSYFEYGTQAEIIGEPTSYLGTIGERVNLQVFTENHSQSRFMWQRLSGGTWHNLPDETQESYLITTASPADAGQYRCRITNNWVSNIMQYSAPITLQISEEESLDGPILREIAANMANTENLPASWDPGNPIDAWEGVTFTNGRVTDIDLKDSEISGAVPAALGKLSELQTLDLSGNQFSGAVPASLQRLSKLTTLSLNNNEFTQLPDLSNLLSLTDLNVSNNRLTFESLLPHARVSNFTYADQKEVGLAQDIAFDDCQSRSISLGFDRGVNNNLYEWFRNNQPIHTTRANSFLGRASELVRRSLFGNWHVQVTNPLLPNLTLSTYPITLRNELNEPCEETSDYNYVQVETVLREGKKSESSLNFLANQELATSYDYVDGLGRTVQRVNEAASPAGHDVVQPIVYDPLGRAKRSYLPYVADHTSGNYRPDALAQVDKFYTATDDAIASTAFPYAETIYEASPLSRATEQGAVGGDWQPSTPGATSNKTIKSNSRTNQTREVRWWQMTNSGIKTNYFRQPNQLFVQETQDELNRSIITYRDKRGLTLLKKVQGETGMLETYYLYDDFGNLRVVVPPKASAELSSNGYDNFSFTSSFIREGCYLYEYDARQRMISQQVPGADPVHLVYDAGDRLVLTQDGNQRRNEQWSFTKYDQLNRPITTGLINNASDRAGMQGQLDSSTNRGALRGHFRPPGLQQRHLPGYRK